MWTTPTNSGASTPDLPPFGHDTSLSKQCYSGMVPQRLGQQNGDRNAFPECTLPQSKGIDTLMHGVRSPRMGQHSVEKERNRGSIDTSILERYLKAWSTSDAIPLPKEMDLSNEAIRKRKGIELEVHFQSITDETKLRYEKQKVKNRITAERSRQRKKAKLDRLEIENCNLRRENEKLLQLAANLYCRLQMQG